MAAFTGQIGTAESQLGQIELGALAISSTGSILADSSAAGLTIVVASALANSVAQGDSASSVATGTAVADSTALADSITAMVLQTTGTALADSSATAIPGISVGLAQGSSTANGVGKVIQIQQNSNATDLVGVYHIFDGPSNIALTFIHGRQVFSQVKPRKSHIRVQLTEDVKIMAAKDGALSINIVETQIRPTKAEPLIFLGFKRKEVEPEVTRRGQIVSV